MTEQEKWERMDGTCGNEYLKAEKFLIYINDTPYYSMKRTKYSFCKFSCADVNCDIEVVNQFPKKFYSGTKMKTNQAYWYIVVNEYDIMPLNKNFK